MLPVNSITSLDQGKLFCAPKNEDEFYARFMTAADKAAPASQKETRNWNFLKFARGGLSARIAG